MPNTLDALFNDRKVFVRLGALLFDEPVVICHVDRYSLVEADGIATQQAVTSKRFEGKEPEVDAYRLLDPGDIALWDPSDPRRLHAEVRAAADAFGLSASGVVWVKGRDVHPNCRHNKVVACLVLLGTTLFVRATTSAVIRAIARPDGADENAYNSLVCQVIRHYGGHGAHGLKLIRWDEDVTRSVRDDLSGATAIDAATDWGVSLQFGDGRTYDPQDDNDRSVLSFILNQGSADDVRRRKKLMGKRIAKLLEGGWGWSEDQLPPGYRLRRGQDGELVRVPGKGKVPEPDPHAVEAIRYLWGLHAQGVKYVDLGRKMADLGIRRRSQKKCASFEELVEKEEWAALGEAAASFFTNASADPHRDLETYLQKVHLLRTGTYRCRVQNEIRGRGRVVNGITAVPWDDTDEFGYFPVEVYWGWPSDPATGEAIERFGLTSEQLDASEARLLSELCPDRVKPQGGAAHHSAKKRALRPAGWSNGAHDYGVMPRTTNSGLFTDVVLRAPTEERARRKKEGSRGGWTHELRHPKKCAVATYALSDLCGSFSNALEHAVEQLLASENLAELRMFEDAHMESESTRRIKILTARLEQLRGERKRKSAEADDVDLLVARAIRKGDEKGAERNEQRAAELRGEAEALASQITSVEAEITTLSASAHEEETREQRAVANLTVAAYLVEGLRRAAANNGVGPARLAEVAREHTDGWRMDVTQHEIGWECTVLVPLASGETSSLGLSGVIDNVRLSQGGRHETSPDVLARQVLYEGRRLDDIIAASHVPTSRGAHLDKRLMPWLRDHGVTSRAAKCAVADHPVLGVRQLIYGYPTGTPVPSDSWPGPLRGAIIGYYTDPSAEGGFAACLDDTVPIQRVLTTLERAGHWAEGQSIEMLAVGLGEKPEYVRALAVPRHRGTGPRRPRFLELHPEYPDRVRLYACPYCRNPGSVAARVLYLGEVAASGYGVICACGRPPVPETDPAHRKWRRIAFHEAFTSAGLITRIAHTSLAEEPQTGFVAMPEPLVLPAGAKRRHSPRTR